MSGWQMNDVKSHYLWNTIRKEYCVAFILKTPISSSSWLIWCNNSKGCYTCVSKYVCYDMKGKGIKGAQNHSLRNDTHHCCVYARVQALQQGEGMLGQRYSGSPSAEMASFLLRVEQTAQGSCRGCVSLSLATCVYYGTSLPSERYGVGSPITPPVSAADFITVISTTTTTRLGQKWEKSKNEGQRRLHAAAAGKQGGERGTNNTNLPSGNVLVTVFFSIHTQFGTRRLSSLRLFNWVARTKATNTHIDISVCSWFDSDFYCLLHIKVSYHDTPSSDTLSYYECSLAAWGYSQDKECRPSLILSRNLEDFESLPIVRMFWQTQQEGEREMNAWINHWVKSLRSFHVLLDSLEVL